MVASKQVEIPHWGGVGRQRGRGFGALAQVIGKTAIPSLRENVVPAAKRIAADMLEFAAPKIGEVISGRKSFKSAAKSVGKQTLKKLLGEGSRRRTEVVNGGESFQQNLLLMQLVPKRRFYFLLIMSNNNFRYQPFVAVSGNLGGKIPSVYDVLSSREQ